MVATQVRMDLLERTEQLEQLHEYLQQAAAGEGRLVLVGGEAGIGKTALIEQFVREARPALPAARSEVVSCDGLKMSGPLGPLFEIAQVLGPEIERLLDEEAPRDRLFRAVVAALAETEQPLLLVGEDAHWVDEATLDLLRFLGRRIGNLRVLFLVTYREDELGPYHPLRRILGDLATAPAVRRMDLHPLSLEAVASLARGSEFDPVALYERTGGNPFYVTEVLAAGTAEVPATVRDAVLARAAHLSPSARAVLDAAAVIGLTVDLDLLEAVIGGPIADEIEECLAVGTLRQVDQRIDFRHGLGRATVLGAISPPRYRALHRRALAVRRADPHLRNDLAYLAFHAEEAGDRETVLAAAPAAARKAAAYGAHREAAAQYARALRFAGGLPPEERADLLEAQSHECFLTGNIEEALTHRREALALRKVAGDRLKQGNTTRWLSRLTWAAGRAEAAERLAHEALALLEPLPPGPELAMAYGNLAQLRMVVSDVPATIEWGERAITLATELGETGTLVHALTSVATAKLLSEDDEGLVLMERALDLARSAGREEDVSRAYVNLAWTASARGQLAAADRFVAVGLEHSAGRDLFRLQHYLRAQRIKIRFAQGNWGAASVEAESTAADPATSPLARTSVLTSLGRIRACQGDDAWVVLDEALALSEAAGGPQRLGPVRAARSEAAWLAGDPELAAEEAARGLESPELRSSRWAAGELMLWLRRAEDASGVVREQAAPGVQVSRETVAEPYYLELTGDWAGAAAQWDRLGFPLEAARARSEGGNEEAVRLALEAFERLGAKPDAARATRRLRELGGRVSRGPRATTRSNPGLLTEREIEVLGLVVAGKSNRDIAERLFVSTKTAGHHVSAILAKLGVASRGEAAAEALRIGLMPVQDRDVRFAI